VSNYKEDPYKRPTGSDEKTTYVADKENDKSAKGPHLLSAVCCLLSACLLVCCLLSAVCCLLPAGLLVYYLLVCYLLVCCLLPAVCREFVCCLNVFCSAVCECCMLFLRLRY
jgi:hypothetical protein